MDNSQFSEQQFRLHLDAMFIGRLLDARLHNRQGSDAHTPMTPELQAQIIAEGCGWTDRLLQQQGRVLQQGQGQPYAEKNQPVGAGHGFGTRERT